MSAVKGALIALALAFAVCAAQASVIVYSNDGLSYRGEADGYSPQPGEVVFSGFASTAQLESAFPGYARALFASQAPQALADHVTLGIVITSTGTSSLNATYALDSVTLDQIGSVARDAASGLGLPGGLSTFTYPDATGVPHTFAASDVQNLYKAMRNLLLLLSEQEALQAAGGSPVWPAQSATIP